MKHRKKHMSEKLLCMALSLSMIAGSPAPAAFAAETEAIVESQSAVALTCATEPMQLTDNGRSIEAKVCLTQPDSLIESAVHKRYSYGDQQWYFEMPMTYFVRLSR